MCSTENMTKINWHMRYSLKLKTSLIAVSVILLSTLLCGTLVIQIVVRQLKEDTIQSADLNARLAVQQMEELFSHIQQAYYNVLYDSKIQQWLTDPETDHYLDSFRQKMDTVLMSSNGSVYSVYIKNFQDSQVLTTDFQTWLPAGDYGGTPSPGTFTVPEIVIQDQFSRMANSKVVSLVGQIYQHGFGSPLGWLSVNTQLSTFTAILREDHYYEAAPILLADTQGGIITTGKTDIPKDLVQLALAANTGDIIEHGGEEYLAVAAQTRSYQWQYRKLLPESLIFAQINYLSSVLLVIFLLFSVVIFLGLYHVLDYITTPIYELSDQVRSYRQSREAGGKWNGTFKTQRKDEFAYLYQSLQEMTQHIDYLIDEEYKAQLYKKETQLRIFRNGVDPHFLYNILDSLLWTIKFGNYRGAEQVLQSLSVFLHHVLNFNKDFVSVKAMKEELSRYCELSCFLKDDTIHWSVEFEDGILEWSVPSMLIQPLVENCFKHAFNGRKEGTILITGGEEAGELVFRVQDNGTGMTDEQRQKLLDYLDSYDFNKESQHFGLASVHQRLKLYYGEGYGLDIATTPGEGTVTRIRLPLKKLTENIE